MYFAVAIATLVENQRGWSVNPEIAIDINGKLNVPLTLYSWETSNLD
ncbi:hypothetical protein [Phormidium sp. CCY1219]|nr:hypothetical protein [Phormidium sp. CCY1219]MEB3826023.1 hypothetical protein [Phormidium sp. CCY1219]